MSEIPSKISYGALIETLERRIDSGWRPDDIDYVQELIIQLAFAQRSVLRKAAFSLNQCSWMDGWSQTFSDRIGFDFQL